MISPDAVRGPGAGLGPQARARALDRFVGETFDVCVIGGGVTGVGCALDAAGRGLSVALVEQTDLAAGTSSRSSKLIHGGLRYLAQFELGLVHEALRERSLMLNRLCPHLVRPVPFVIPIRHRLWERPYLGAGVGIYDLIASIGDNPLPHHRHLGRRGVARALPGLDPASYLGGIRYWDAQVDDARHTVAVARTAAVHGAAILTSAKVIGLRRARGRVEGVVAVDRESGDEIEVRARTTVSAAGVWTDEIDSLGGDGRRNVRAAKGVHLVFPRAAIDATCGVALQTPTSVLFVIPWGEHWLVGTTDTDWDHDLGDPVASAADIDYILGRLNGVLHRPLDVDDIVSVYAGLRPLLAGESDQTSKLSREHAVRSPAPGLYTVAGGKYTTYRVMAADTIDALSDDLGPLRDSPTADLAILGADGHSAFELRADALAAGYGISLDQVSHLLGRYGSLVGEVLAASEPDARGEPVPGAPRYLMAELTYAASHECAIHLDDLLVRRTRIAMETPDHGVAAAGAAADAMGDVLGWTPQQRRLEVDLYLGRVAAENAASVAPDDRSAVAARRAARDPRDVRT